MNVNQLLNHVLVKSGSSAEADPLNSNNVDSKNLKVLYETEKEFMLSAFPWNFNTRNYLLTRVGQGEKYYYKYEIPKDVVTIWKVTDNKQDIGSLYGSYWNGKVVYSSSSMPAFNYNYNVYGESEVINGFLETNFEQAWLICSTNQFPVDLDVHFANVLRYKLITGMAQYKQKDSDSLGLTLKMNDAEAKKVMEIASKNKGQNDSVGKPSILGVIEGYESYGGY